MEIGEIVTAFNKTGKYIGEITGVRPDSYTVRVLAVLTHPMQGDLHNPKQAEVPFFHERKALAYREQANIPLKMVRPFDGELPDYPSSLQESFVKLRQNLQENQDDAFNRKSLEALDEIAKEYRIMYKIDC